MNFTNNDNGQVKQILLPIKSTVRNHHPPPWPPLLHHRYDRRHRFITFRIPPFSDSSPMAPFTASLILLLLLIVFSAAAGFFPNCNQIFSCGDLEDITYPFTGGNRPSYCGPPEFRLSCRNDLPELTISSLSYRVVQIDQDLETLTLARVRVCSRKQEPTGNTSNRKWLSGWEKLFRKKETNEHQGVEEFLRNCGSLAPKRYKYSEIKKMTNGFMNNVGQGGFGAVYKGKLSDGRLVAVKVLKESKSNGEEFMNEVASISRTSHVNVVTLLGFCYERSRRALIYEFMSNGSLDKFIYDDGSLRTNPSLEWKVLYRISVGIARGLEYLHQGCNTRIVHFDIKPHNILLDEDFCPKISDFGLAKLCKRKESLVSMLGARGTIGYIAPEVFCRNFGGVSHKSDVYSFGMMVLEMVAGRKNIDVGVSKTSEIYFPHWIYKDIESVVDLRLPGITTPEDDETARKMILVSLWCIQTSPSDRPSMTKVVEMLEGSLQSVTIPPKPILSSPPRSPRHSSTTSASFSREEEQHPLS